MDLRNRINIPYLQGLFLVLLSQILYAQQDKPAMSSGDIQFYMDKAVFTAADNSSLVEFYFMFFADQVKFSSNDKGELDIKLVIDDQSGKNISEREWKLNIALAGIDSTGTRTKVFYDQINETLDPGTYRIFVSVRDQISRKKGELQTSIRVPETGSKDFSGSEIEFVSSVDSKNVAAPFKKGNKNIIPNPSRRYGILNPILYIYYELYNINTTSDDSLVITYSFISQNSDTVKRFPQILLERKNSTSGITHGLNAANIPSGIYNLNINVADNGNDAEIILARNFEIIQKDYADIKTTTSAEDSKTFENLLTIIGAPGQVKTYRQLPEIAKASYIIEFWKSLDPTPGTPENEYLQKVQQRYLFANDKFGWQETEGWSSERGRVLIKYGMPDEIEQHDSEPNTVPYQIWYYRQEKSYLFVFGDLQSNGRYILLHSDKEGELSDVRWPEYIRKL